MSSRGLRLPWQLEFTQQLSSLNHTLAYQARQWTSAPPRFSHRSDLLSQTFLAQPSVFEPGLPSSRFSMRALVASSTRMDLEHCRLRGRHDASLSSETYTIVLLCSLSPTTAICVETFRNGRPESLRHDDKTSTASKKVVFFFRS